MSVNDTAALLADARRHLTNGTGCPSCVYVLISELRAALDHEDLA